MPESAPARMAFRPGDWICDRYQVEGVLGQGGMGTVLAARHAALGLPVAIKVMHRRLRDDAELCERFLREAQALASVTSDHVARVSDFGTTGDDVPFFVMDRLEGIDLARHLTAHGTLEEAEAVDLAQQIARGLRDIHREGIVHRDLKPSNVFLTPSPMGAPIIKILDFGISKVPRGEALTSIDHVIGSPRYMAPEQMWQPSNVDGRSDLWSLGVILFEAITGHVPFEGKELFDIGAYAGKGALPLTNFVATVSPAFAAVVDRCLRPDPAERFASAEALLAELARIAADEDPPAPAKGSVRPTTTPATHTKRPTRKLNVRRGHILLAAIVGWGAAVGAGAQTLLGRPSGREAPPRASGAPAAERRGDPDPGLAASMRAETEIRTGPGEAYAKLFVGATVFALERGQPVDVLAEEEDRQARGNVYLHVEFRSYWANCLRMRAYVPRSAVVCGGSPCVAPEPQRPAPQLRRYVGTSPLLLWPDPGSSCDAGAYGSLQPRDSLTVLAVDGKWALLEYLVTGARGMLGPNNGKQKRAYVPYDDAAFEPLPR